MNVTEFVAALEDTEAIQNADDVAEFLYQMDIRNAIAGDAILCPLAQGLTQCGVRNVAVGGLDAEGEIANEVFHSWQHFWENDAVPAFVTLLDAGAYPEMIFNAEDLRRRSGWYDNTVADFLEGAGFN